jgi:hypothetical protein
VGDVHHGLEDQVPSAARILRGRMVGLFPIFEAHVAMVLELGDPGPDNLVL